ncbi:MAG TPA: response regulator [Thermoanaerobaculia bacterium]|nr:response regulator [Thermoanaerobaculia bacterium]
MPLPLVLVVEDDRPTREALRTMLEAEGCAVEVAVDGEKAIGALAQRRYDAIILDIVLPKLSGTDVMEYIAVTRPESLASIIVVTGLDVQEIRKLFPTICETLSKPVIRNRLVSSVRRCLGSSESSMAAWR